MVLQFLIGFVAVLASIQTSNAQCSETQQLVFVAGLPNGLQCGLGRLAANSTPTVEGLNSVCTVNCAGAVSAWLAGPTCNDTFTAAGLAAWCQPADGGRISRCRFINDTLFSGPIGQCAWFNSSNPVCPGTCATGLRNLAEEIGCCYQLIYNDTLGLDGLYQAGEITTMERGFLELLRQTALWDICDVQIAEQCTSPMFSMATITTDAITTDAITTDAITTASGIKTNFSITHIILSFLSAFAY